MGGAYIVRELLHTTVEQYFWDRLSKWTPVDKSPPYGYMPNDDDGANAERSAGHCLRTRSD